jgi:tetratricopeptide (TPR) repeat protein
LARPPLLERKPEWAAAIGAEPLPDAADSLVPPHVWLPLEPLSYSDSGALVDEILQRVDRVPEGLRNLVVEGAAGNPYYVEELIKRLIEDGVIVRGEDSWTIESDRLTRVRVPSTLTGVLQARMDSLPREEKLVLQRASVVGRQFWDAAVVVLAGEDVGSQSIAALLDDLSNRELIFQREPSALAGTTEYMFKHALLHDVVYETVLLKDRSVYHGRVAQWLEETSAERPSEYYALIAGHYELAGRSGRAAEYLRRSAAELNLMGAYRDAISTYERALTLCAEDDLRNRAEILVGTGNAARQMGDFPQASARLYEGLTMAQEMGDTATEIAALNWLGLSVRVQGDNDEADRYLNRALELARETGDRPGLALSLYNLGDVAFRRGQADEAERCGSESLAIYEDLGDRQGMAFALRVCGFAATLTGDYAQAVEFHQHSLAIYREIGDMWGLAACRINIGEAYRNLGDFETAASHLEESLAIAGETGARYELAVCHNNLGHVYQGTGDFEKSEEYLALALGEAMSMGVIPIALESLVGVAMLRMRDGLNEEAAELLGQVLTHPSLHDETMKYAEPVLEDLRSAMSPRDLEAGMARGAQRELKAVVRELTRGTA